MRIGVQQLAVSILQEMIAEYQNQNYQNLDSVTIDSRLAQGLAAIIDDPNIDTAMKALMLLLPSQKYMAEVSQPIDIKAIHDTHEYLMQCIAHELQNSLWKLFNEQKSTEDFSVSAEAIGKRSLKNTALRYLVLVDKADYQTACLQQYEQANNMTDQYQALSLVCHSKVDKLAAYSDKLLNVFYEKWHDNALVVNQWLGVQASSPDVHTLANVKKLMVHEAFSIKNPNKVRALIGGFCGNAINFHKKDGEGYQFLVEQIIALNTINPQIASRLVTPLTRWRQYLPQQQRLMQQALEDIIAIEDLSKDVYEVVSKSLHGA